MNERVATQVMDLAYNMKRIQYQINDFRYKTRSTVTSLENSLSKISRLVNQLEQKVYGQLPSQAERNPRHQIQAMQLRGGKMIDNKVATSKA